MMDIINTPTSVVRLWSHARTFRRMWTLIGTAPSGAEDREGLPRSAWGMQVHALYLADSGFILKYHTGAVSLVCMAG